MLDMSYEDTWLTRNLTPIEYREYLNISIRLATKKLRKVFTRYNKEEA